MRTEGFLTALMVLLAPLAAARAEQFADKLPYRDFPARHGVVVFEGSKSSIDQAALEKQPEALLVSAEASKYDWSALVAGIIELPGGEVISAPLHSARFPELNSRTTGVAREELAALEERAGKARARIAQLEAEIETARVELRRKAGLAEVDEINSKIARLDERSKRIKELRDRIAGYDKF